MAPTPAGPNCAAPFRQRRLGGTEVVGSSRAMLSPVGSIKSKGTRGLPRRRGPGPGVVAGTLVGWKLSRVEASTGA